MIQHRASPNNVFINSAHKLKKKHGETQPHFFLNLKKTCVCFSKQQNNENIYLKKQIVFFVSTSSFLLIMLIIDFIILVKQKVFKKDLFTYKYTIKKIKDVSKKTNVFIKNTTYVFVTQQTLKQQQK